MFTVDDIKVLFFHGLFILPLLPLSFLQLRRSREDIKNAINNTEFQQYNHPQLQCIINIF